MANYNDVLSDLTSRAHNVARSGDDKEKEQFNATLMELASSKTKDPNLRQAAMQLRLPDVQVGRNEDGNLSFSKPTTTNPQLPRDFAAQPTVVSSGETAIVGTENAMAILNGRGRATVSNVTPNQLSRIGDSASSPMIKGVSAQISKINEMQDPKAKQEAFLNLSESIALAKNTRQIELINMKERELGVPQLEEQLRREEAADRADPLWERNQVDSPITSQIRQRLRTTKADAYTYGEREIAVDPVLGQMQAEIQKTQGLIQLGVSAAEEGEAVTFSTFSPEQQRRTKAATAATKGVSLDQVTDEEATKFLNNPTVQAASQMSEVELLAASVDPAMRDNKTFGQTLANLGTVDDVPFLQEHMKALQEIRAAKGNPEKMPAASEKTLSLVNDQRVQQIVQQYNQSLLTATDKDSRERAEAGARLGMAKLAFDLYTESKMAEIPDKVMELPQPTDPSLLPVYKSVVDKGTGIRGMLNDETVNNLLNVNDPAQLEANINSLVNYLIPIYRSKAPTPINGVDPIVAKEREIRQLLNNRAVRLDAVNSFFMGGPDLRPIGNR